MQVCKYILVIQQSIDNIVEHIKHIHAARSRTILCDHIRVSKKATAIL